MSENSYLHEFCAQVSKSVFLGDLTVSRLITTVFVKRLNHLRTRFLTLVHKTRGDMSFPTFLFIQL